MAKSFPCWVCKGQGGERDIVISETGEGPWYDCAYCEGNGLIEIGSPLHRRRKAEQIAIEIVKFAGKKDEYSWAELQEIGENALKLA